jgi:hypothetical protein
LKVFCFSKQEMYRFGFRSEYFSIRVSDLQILGLMCIFIVDMQLDLFLTSC